jgi:hypothetical protein
MGHVMGHMMGRVMIQVTGQMTGHVMGRVIGHAMGQGPSYGQAITQGVWPKTGAGDKEKALNRTPRRHKPQNTRFSARDLMQRHPRHYSEGCPSIAYRGFACKGKEGGVAGSRVLRNEWRRLSSLRKAMKTGQKRRLESLSHSLCQNKCVISQDPRRVPHPPRVPRGGRDEARLRAFLPARPIHSPGN